MEAQDLVCKSSIGPRHKDSPREEDAICPTCHSLTHAEQQQQQMEVASGEGAASAETSRGSGSNEEGLLLAGGAPATVDAGQGSAAEVKQESVDEAKDY